MKPTKKWQRLAEFCESGEICRLTRKFDSYTYYGVVLAVSDNWVLLHEFDTTAMTFGGYQLCRMVDITKVEWHGSFLGRAAERLGQNAVPLPEIDLSSLPAFFASIPAESFPLVSVHREKKYPDSCWIGKITKIGKRGVTLQDIDVEAVWGVLATYRYSEITRVDFGGGYENALWMLASDGETEAEESTNA
jgi:hypothetical protein